MAEMNYYLKESVRCDWRFENGGRCVVQTFDPRRLCMEHLPPPVGETPGHLSMDDVIKAKEPNVAALGALVEYQGVLGEAFGKRLEEIAARVSARIEHDLFQPVTNTKPGAFSVTRKELYERASIGVDAPVRVCRCGCKEPLRVTDSAEPRSFYVDSAHQMRDARLRQRDEVISSARGGRKLSLLSESDPRSEGELQLVDQITTLRTEMGNEIGRRDDEIAKLREISWRAQRRTEELYLKWKEVQEGAASRDAAWEAMVEKVRKVEEENEALRRSAMPRAHNVCDRALRDLDRLIQREGMYPPNVRPVNPEVAKRLLAPTAREAESGPGAVAAARAFTPPNRRARDRMVVRYSEED